MTHAVITTRQDAARSRNDNGNETAATWKAATNTAWTLTFAVSDVFLTFRHRFVIQEVGGGSVDNFLEEIQFSHNGGTWTNVGATTTVRYTASGFYADGDDTTQQLGGGTFVDANSAMTESDYQGSSTEPDMSGNDEFEAEFMLRINKADISDTDTIRLRVMEDGAELDQYDAASLFDITMEVIVPERRVFIID
jgi:hypothetical protein